MVRSLLLLLGLLLSAPQAAADPELLQQARQLPEGFEEHFFGVPLMVRVTVDDRLLGDGEVLLGRDNSVQLLSLVDVQESEFDEGARERWLTRLGSHLPLGECSRACPEGIVGLQYSLEESQLSVLTGEVEQEARDQRFMTLPQESKGLLIQNQLNLVQGTQRNGHYNLQLEGSWGQWTPFMEGDATWQEGQSSEVGLAQLYGERLHEANFYRLGFFFPSAQGLVRQPNYYSGATPTVLGMMWGSSDLLRRERGVPSLAPIQVAPARPGMVEIYRDGNLIQSQPVVSGLQALDTRSLPGGIYEVELRLLEDGQETRRWREMIYKPSNWQTPEEPWRFNLFAGRQTRWLVRQGDSDLEGASGGVAVNHLLLPSLVVGAGSQYVDRRASTPSRLIGRRPVSFTALPPSTRVLASGGVTICRGSTGMATAVWWPAIRAICASRGKQVRCPACHCSSRWKSGAPSVSMFLTSLVVVMALMWGGTIAIGCGGAG